GIGLSLFQTITQILETRAFQKALEKIGGGIERVWDRRKSDLARSVGLKSIGFQKWRPGGPDCYSVRVDGNYRVHLRHDPADGSWVAESIGDHKSMGHG